MACERWREMLSAQLDGEDDPADRALVEEHLAGCAGCRAWFEQAALVNRLTRTAVPVPDLGDRILAALPAQPASLPLKRRFSFATLLFLALAGVGAVQLILGLNQIGGGVTGAHVHTGLDATPGHLWNESAAWNVSVGAGYLFIALRRTRPSGLVPMLTAFVGMLLLLSLNDLTGDRVDGTRLISHGFVILGYLLVVALSKMPGGFAAPPGQRIGAGSGWRASFADDEDDEVTAPTRPGLRLLPGGPLTAEHEERQAA
ncbi:zf-HC2 domain-containing protein [Actinoplanes sp. NPDC051343]|uniref:zf-HC2 domain-containing protein n=1 Tax=Actinoplanes sp. NPDC051343 TaxID=3363906 RepID=UPI0037BB0601